MNELRRAFSWIWFLLFFLTSVPFEPALTPEAFAQTGGKPPVHYTYSVVSTYPHDPSAFTQGLVFEDGFFYEGTGLYGQSSLRMVKAATGEVLQIQRLSPHYFGEGITVHEDRIIQLTWKSGTGFVYDKKTFAPLSTFSYTMEGWGLTHDGTRLIMSDGSSSLYFLDPYTFQVVDRLSVADGAHPVERLNELEFIEGEIFANVWQTDRIARISPKTGQVTAWIDLSGLLSPEDRLRRVDVLNGIAYDPRTERLFVTGKWWPRIFEIELVPTRQ